MVQPFSCFVKCIYYYVVIGGNGDVRMVVVVVVVVVIVVVVVVVSIYLSISFSLSQGHISSVSPQIRCVSGLPFIPSRSTAAKS